MPFAELYRRQAGLLVRVLPFVATETCFALKGGTAINLFLRNMPRLSVDIDLVYLPVADRQSSLAAIDAALHRIGERIISGIPLSRVAPSRLAGEGRVTRVVVGAEGVQIKIEVTPVLRGCVYPPESRAVSQRVEDQFGFAEIQVVSFADLYAGKIVAALDRQHPRDLFDVHDLLRNEGIDEQLRKAFVVYLLSHNRPMAEILAPVRRDIAPEFRRGFEGMTEHRVALDDLLRIREELVTSIVDQMPHAHRRFLVSAKRGEPDWSLLDVPEAEALPAVRWRLANLAKLETERHESLLARLQEVLDISD